MEEETGYDKALKLAYRLYVEYVDMDEIFTDFELKFLNGSFNKTIPIKRNGVRS